MNPEQLLEHVPDEAAFVDTRGLLLSGRARIVGEGEGWLAVDTASPLVCVVGAPSAALVRETLDQQRDRYVLAPTDQTSRLATALPEWDIVGATLHVRPSMTPPTMSDVPVWTFTRQSTAWSTLDLAHVPEDLREELDGAVGRALIVTAWLDDRPVAFAYPAFVTERWFDISVDTVAAYRRRGAASAAVSTLIELMEVAGRAPVWGADDRNVASMRLAEKLGFVPAARLALVTARES